MTEYNKHSSFIYKFLILCYPFSVLFCPPINLGVCYARADELLAIAFLPVSLNDFKRPSLTQAKKWSSLLYKSLIAIFSVYFIGIILGNGSERWATSYIRFICHPISLIINLLVLRYLYHQSRIRKYTALITMCSAIVLAGVIGLLAMFYPGLSSILQHIYVPELANSSRQFAFDMQVRAMSVFTGYDAASVTYALGVIICLILFYTGELKSKIMNMMVLLMIGLLFVSIVSSARIGFIAGLAGWLAFFIIHYRPNFIQKLLFGCVILTALYLFPIIASFVFPTANTIDRFVDALSIFDLSNSSSVIERSSGLSAVYHTQFKGLTYPEGPDLIFGFGDNGIYISDIAFVTFFVKSGLVGVVAILYVLCVWAVTGLKLDNIRKRIGLPMEQTIVNTTLPCISVLFLVAALKGPLYFVGYKIGELVLMLLCLAFIEAEQILKARSPRIDHDLYGKNIVRQTQDSGGLIPYKSRRGRAGCL